MNCATSSVPPPCECIEVNCVIFCNQFSPRKLFLNIKKLRKQDKNEEKLDLSKERDSEE
jgi:hypothetical protein